MAIHLRIGGLMDLGFQLKGGSQSEAPKPRADDGIG